MSSCEIFSGVVLMKNDKLYRGDNMAVCFPKGIANGNVACLLWSWIDLDAPLLAVKPPFTLVGTCRFIGETEFFVISETARHRRLKVNISGENIDVIMFNEEDEAITIRCTLSRVDLTVSKGVQLKISLT